MSLDANKLIEELDNAGFDAQAYSGRAMFGKQCVSITVESERDIWNLAYSFGDAGFDPGAPRTDSMGRDIVAYWPSAEWPA